MYCCHATSIAWNVLHVMPNETEITGNLCNKCPKWQFKQNCSSSDSFNAISGFTSNSRAPGGPVTETLAIKEGRHLNTLICFFKVLIGWLAVKNIPLEHL